MSNLPNLYAWCFSHGRMHVFDPDNPWCAASWVPLNGETESDALSEKQEKYGRAAFLKDLSADQRTEVTRERRT